MSPSAIAIPPSGLMLLKVRLRAGEKKAGVEFQRGLTQQKRTLSAAHSRLVICISLRMAASAEAPLSPTSLSRILRGKMGGGSGERAGGCQQGADTERRALGAQRFEGPAAYSSSCSEVLPLRPSARAAPPSGPRLLDEILRAWEQRRELRHVNGR